MSALLIHATATTAARAHLRVVKRIASFRWMGPRAKAGPFCTLAGRCSPPDRGGQEAQSVADAPSPAIRQGGSMGQGRGGQLLGCLGTDLRRLQSAWERHAGLCVSAANLTKMVALCTASTWRTRGWEASARFRRRRTCWMGASRPYTSFRWPETASATAIQASTARTGHHGRCTSPEAEECC